MILALRLYSFCYFFCLVACTDANQTASDQHPSLPNTQATAQAESESLSDTFDYQSLFKDDLQVAKKSKSSDDWQDTLSGGLYWLNLDALDDKPIQRVQPADPDPPHDYFVAVDREPQLMNVDSVLENIRVDAEIRQQIGPSRIWIKLLINRDGRPKDYFVVRSPDKRVSREVLDKLRMIRAKPAQLQNKAVKCWVNIQYNLV